MTIQQITITWYRVKCHTCGAEGPKSPVQEEALWQAFLQGWQHHGQWNGHEYVHRDLCPACSEKWKAEQPDGRAPATAEHLQEPSPGRPGRTQIAEEEKPMTEEERRSRLGKVYALLVDVAHDKRLEAAEAKAKAETPAEPADESAQEPG
jgi:hypothetical protein